MRPPLGPLLRAVLLEARRGLVEARAGNREAGVQVRPVLLPRRRIERPDRQGPLDVGHLVHTQHLAIFISSESLFSDKKTAWKSKNEL